MARQTIDIKKVNKSIECTLLEINDVKPSRERCDPLYTFKEIRGLLGIQCIKIGDIFFMYFKQF